jgi:hypothetical protein
MKKAVVAAFALALAAAVAVANDHHGGMGPGGPGMGGHDGFGGPVLVSSSGTAFVESATRDSAGNETVTVTAISPSGTKAWTATLPSGSHGRLVLSGSNLITQSETVASDGTVTTTLTALSTATGSVAWTLTINGRVTELEPFSGGTYAVVIIPPATSGGSATRSLEAIGSSGNVLWTVSL